MGDRLVIFVIFSYEFMNKLDTSPEKYGIFSHIFMMSMWLFQLIGGFLHWKSWLFMWQCITENPFMFTWKLDQYKATASRNPYIKWKLGDNTIVILISLYTIVFLVVWYNGMNFDTEIRSLVE